MPELSAEDEARLDADPRERLFDMNKIEAPSVLGPLLGAFTKLLMLQERSDVADYAVEYFEHMKLARAADPRIDFDRFLSTQLKLMQKQAEPHTYDYRKEFEPPDSLATILVAFSKEVIRYQPVDVIAFALEYFSAIAETGSAELFLIKQGKMADEKQRTVDAEKKRAQITKEKKKKAALEDDE